MLVVPSSNSTSRLNIGTDDASSVVPVVKNCGLKPFGAAFGAVDERLGGEGGAAREEQRRGGEAGGGKAIESMAFVRPDEVGLQRSEPES